MDRLRSVALLLILACAATLEPAGADDTSAQAEPCRAEDPDCIPAASPEGDGDDVRTVDLVIQGEEADPRLLQFGGGWNEVDGFYGRVSLSDRNLFGSGQYLGLGLETGDRRQRYELEYRKLWLFDRPQWLGVRLFSDSSEDPVAEDTVFDRRRSGVALTFARRFRSFHRFRVDYTLADVDDTESLAAESFAGVGEPISRQTSYRTSSLRPRWIYDTLDSRAAPFRGLRLDGSLEVAGGILGGDLELVKPLAGLTWFRPLSEGRFRSTLGLRTRAGWLDARGDDDLFAQQRFFLGGDTSVRGFRRRSLAVLDDDGATVLDADGLPLGGDRFAQLSLEVHALLPGPLRLVLFADAGGVFDSDRGVAWDGMRQSAGAELWLTLPKLKVPLRFIYAENLDPLPGDRFDDLSVSLGVSF